MLGPHSCGIRHAVGGSAEQARIESAAPPRPRWLICDWASVDPKIASEETVSSSSSQQLLQSIKLENIWYTGRDKNPRMISLTVTPNFVEVVASATMPYGITYDCS